MHACGHDNHMAILLGTATALARMKDRLPGTVKVIFQPAEEGPPADAGRGGDLLDGGGVEALEGEQAQGDQLQLPPAGAGRPPAPPARYLRRPAG